MHEREILYGSLAEVLFFGQHWYKLILVGEYGHMESHSVLAIDLAYSYAGHQEIQENQKLVVLEHT